MGNGKLLAMRTQAKGGQTVLSVSDATNQAQPTVSVPGTISAGNVGGLSTRFFSDNDDAIFLSRVTRDGDIGTARAKVSIRNPGGPVWRGRNNSSVAESTVRALADSSGAGSHEVMMDTDGDGVPDKRFIVVQDRGHASERVILYESTNFDAPVWSQKTVIVDNSVATLDLSPSPPGLIVVPGSAGTADRMVVYWAEETFIKCKYSVDYGVSFSETIVCALPGYAGDIWFEVRLLVDGTVGMAYEKLSSNYRVTQYATSDSGIKFTDVSIVESGGSVDRKTPSFCQFRDGTLYVFQVQAGVGGEAFTSEDDGETWVAVATSITVNATDTEPSCAVAPDDDIMVRIKAPSVSNTTIYKFCTFPTLDNAFLTSSDKVTESLGTTYFKSMRLAFIAGFETLTATYDSGGTDYVRTRTTNRNRGGYSPPGARTPAYTGSGTNDLSVDGSNLSFDPYVWIKFDVEIDGTGAQDTFRWRINGGGWTSLVNCTTEYQELGSYGFLVKFAAITGHNGTEVWSIICDPSFSEWVHDGFLYMSDSPNDAWLTWDGGAGGTEDTETVQTAFGFPKERALLGDPKWRARSTGDNAQWDLTFYAGANRRFPVDLVAVMGHFRSCLFQGNNTASWAAPPLEQAITTDKEIFTNVSGEVGAIYESGAGMIPHKYADGKHWLWLSNGNPYEILDNDAERIYVDADLSALGVGIDAYIAGDRAWKSVTESRYLYYNLRITAHHTPNNYFDAIIFMGQSIPLLRDTKRGRLSQAVDVHKFPSGAISTNQKGGPAENYVLSMVRMGLDDTYEKVRSALIYNDTKANTMIYIPDDTNEKDFRIVIATGDVTFDPVKTRIPLAEMI